MPFQRMKNYRTVPDTGPEVFEQYEIASWKVGGSQKIAFPVISVDESGGNRLAARKRPYRHGAKFDDIGANETNWTLTAIFKNDLEEPGLTEINGDTALYPDVLNNLIDTFRLYHDEPGDLVIPTRGKVRARLQSYSRGERHDERDFASVSLVFVEDNEDNVDAASFNLPSVKANSRRVAEEIEESAQEDGAWDTSLQDLMEYAAQIEGMINAPQEYKRDFESQAKLVIGAIRRVTSAFTQRGKEGRDLFSDPKTEATQRSLVSLEDMVGRELAEARRGRPQLIMVTYPNDRSLMSIGVELGQSYEDLVEVNTQLEDPMHIPAGELVRVFANGSA